jgi:ATP-binding cassette subfamily F protein 3
LASTTPSSEGETARKPVGRLSAGERAKALLAALMLGGHNLLVLDEPTNHLDIETQDVLLEALKGFPGGVLFVSHDRHFAESLATQSLPLRGARRPPQGALSRRRTA